MPQLERNQREALVCSIIALLIIGVALITPQALSAAVAKPTAVDTAGFTTEARPAITTVAGTPCGNVGGALGMATQASAVEPDGDGGFFVSHYAQAAVCHVAADGSVSLTAGSGDMRFGGDDGPATDAQLYSPAGLAYNRATHDLFIADRWNQRVRKVDSLGVITTVAGVGTVGATGDRGPAAAAQLNFPTGVALDPSGNLYIADTANNRIRKVSVAGVITTVAGKGAAGFGGDGGVATAALLKAPTDIATGTDGSLYIADTGNHRVRRVSSAGIISTFAGVASGGYAGDGGPASLARLQGPGGVAVSDSALFIADTGNNRVRRVALADGVITTIAGSVAGFGGDSGSAAAAKLSWPVGVAVDGSRVLIADSGNNRVRRITNGNISTVAGNGTAALAGDGGKARLAQFYEPLVMVFGPDRAMYVADGLNHSVRKIARNGVITTVAGSGIQGFSGDGGPATSARLGFPSGLAFDPSGNLYIADEYNNRIRKVNAGNGIITTFAGTGVAGFGGDGGLATKARLNAPIAVAFAPDGGLIIADNLNNRVRRVGVDGVMSTIAGDGKARFAGDGGSARAASLKGPGHVTFDPAGNLVVTDRLNDRIRRIDHATGIITTIAGNGIVGYSPENTLATRSALNYPATVTFDSAGALYISDTGSCIIRRVTNPGAPGATIETVAGWTPARGVRPTCGFVGENVHPRAAMLDHPTGVTFDSKGNWYIADTLSNRIRLVAI